MVREDPDSPTVLVRFSRRDRALIHDDTFYDSDLIPREPQEASEIPVEMTLDDVEDLQGHVAAAANHCKSLKKQRELDRLYDKLQEILAEHS